MSRHHPENEIVFHKEANGDWVGQTANLTYRFAYCSARDVYRMMFDLEPPYKRIGFRSDSEAVTWVYPNKERV